MDKQIFSLTIADKENLEAGVHQAVIFNDVLELAFFKEGQLIKTVSLAPDRASFYRTLEATKAKITLISKRLDIDESQLSYKTQTLGISQKLIYKSLILAKMIYTMLIPIQWVIVYKHQHDKKWRKIIPDSSVFQADPFIVYKDDKYYVFYEELKFEDYHGYLRAAELDVKNGKLINDKIILKLEHHLSFPSVFEEDGSFYMIPECANSHSVDLFECTDFPYIWQKKQTLIDNIQAVDSTLLKVADDSPLKSSDDTWYLFTTEITQGASCDDELSIYKSADLFTQPFTKLYQEPVISDVTNARMAGHFIQRDGEIIRMSQNCGKRYGYQANLNKVLQIEDGYKEELIETIKPSQGALGFHTYNQAHEIIIGDMEIARFDWYSLKRFIGGNLRRLFEIILGKDNSSKN